MFSLSESLMRGSVIEPHRAHDNLQLTEVGDSGALLYDNLTLVEIVLGI